MAAEVPSSRGRKKPRMTGTIDTTEADKAIPKSIIIYRGEVGSKVRILMQEWRMVFAPWSSRKLHATNNTIKDFIHIASTFSVSHLQLFACPSHGTTLRVMRFSNGPTLTFRVESFQLREDIVAKQRRPAPGSGPLYETSPIVVLNNFKSATSPELALVESTFQALFPPVNVQTTRPSAIHRTVLFQYDPASNTIEVRHFWVTAKNVGLSKTVKRLAEGHIPSRLGTVGTVDEVLDQEGAWSDTDGEGEEIELAKPFRGIHEQARVKLVEIGPRLTLSLMKIEAGFGHGEVLFNAHNVKTPQEVALNAMKIRRRTAEKSKRRSEQDANVKKKKDAAQEKLDRRKMRRTEVEQERRAHHSDDDDDDDGHAGFDVVPA